MIEGGFRYGNDLYHVKAAHQYNLVKRSSDPVAKDTAMVMYRDSDTVLKKRESSSHQCGFDNMMMPREVEQFTGGLLTKRFEQGCPIAKKSKYTKLSPFIVLYKN